MPEKSNPIKLIEHVNLRVFLPTGIVVKKIAIQWRQGGKE